MERTKQGKREKNKARVEVREEEQNKRCKKNNVGREGIKEERKQGRKERRKENVM